MAKDHQASQGIQLFEFEETSSHILTTLKLGKTPHTFIIDTGASVSVIDRAQAEPYLLEHEEGIIAYGLGGELEDAARIWVHDAKFSRATLPPFPMITADLSQLISLYTQYEGPAISGLLGNDFLRLFQGAISYRTNRITISIPEEGFQWATIPALLKDAPEPQAEPAEATSAESVAPAPPKPAKTQEKKKKSTKRTAPSRPTKSTKPSPKQSPKATENPQPAPRKSTSTKTQKIAQKTEDALARLRNATKSATTDPKSQPSPTPTKAKGGKPPKSAKPKRTPKPKANSGQ